jgi:hypothetical protein
VAQASGDVSKPYGAGGEPPAGATQTSSEMKSRRDSVFAFEDGDLPVVVVANEPVDRAEVTSTGREDSPHRVKASATRR